MLRDDAGISGSPAASLSPSVSIVRILAVVLPSFSPRGADWTPHCRCYVKGTCCPLHRSPNRLFFLALSVGLRPVLYLCRQVAACGINRLPSTSVRGHSPPKEVSCTCHPDPSHFSFPVALPIFLLLLYYHELPVMLKRRPDADWCVGSM